MNSVREKLGRHTGHEKESKDDNTVNNAVVSVVEPRLEQASNSDARVTVSVKDIPRECMTKVMAFLFLKDGMALRGSSRHFRFQVSEETGNRDDCLDVFRYCHLRNGTRGGFMNSSLPIPKDDNLRILEQACQDVATLEEALANETFPQSRLGPLTNNFVGRLEDALIEGDNGPALALLESHGYLKANDGRPLRRAIQGRQFAAASVLEAFLEQVGSIQTCSLCDENVAVLQCSSGNTCVHYPETDHHMNYHDRDALVPSLCRPCASNARVSCQLCSRYLCADCNSCHVSFSRCSVCKIKVCRKDSCMEECGGCVAVVCKPCLGKDGMQNGRCPDCVNDEAAEVSTGIPSGGGSLWMNFMLFCEGKRRALRSAAMTQVEETVSSYSS